MEPPIHVEYLRSGGPKILIFIVDGANAVISFCILSAMPGYMVLHISEWICNRHDGYQDGDYLREMDEKGLRAAKLFITDGNHLTIRQFITLLHTGTTSSSLHLLLKVQSNVNVTQLFLNVTDNVIFISKLLLMSVIV